MQVFKHLKMESTIDFTENISEADAIIALLSKIKKNSRIQAAAHSSDVPIYVTKVSIIIIFYFFKKVMNRFFLIGLLINLCL